MQDDTYPVGEKGCVSVPLPPGQHTLRVSWDDQACEAPLPHGTSTAEQPAHAILCVGAIVVSGTPVAFLNYDPVSATDKDAAGLITVGCAGVGVLGSFTVKLNISGYGSFATRQLGVGAARLDYNLYRNCARTEIWGDGTSSSYTQAFDALISLGTVDYFVYGRIPKGQDRPSGTYQSTITSTVDF